MFPVECISNRRNFLKGGLALGLSSLIALPVATAAAEEKWIVGPQPGFTPEIGTLTSMLAFTREQVVYNVKGLSQQDLDFLAGLHVVQQETRQRAARHHVFETPGARQQARGSAGAHIGIARPRRKLTTRG